MLLLCGIVLAILGFLWIYFHREDLNLVDLYIFFVCQYFGLMSIIDGVLNGSENYDMIYILESHFIVLLAIIGIAFFCKSRVGKKYLILFRIRTLIEIFGEVSSISIRVLAVITMSILFYFYMANGSESFSHSSIFPSDDSSYWVTSLLMIFRVIFSASTVGMFLLIIRRKRKNYLILAFDILIFSTFLLNSSLFGRTVAFSISLLCTLAWFYTSFRKSYFPRLVFYSSIGLVFLILFSNYHQTYRGGKNRGAEFPAGIGSDRG